MMHRLLISDDHPVAQHGVAQFCSAPDLEVVALVPDAKSTLAACEELTHSGTFDRKKLHFQKTLSWQLVNAIFFIAIEDGKLDGILKLEATLMPPNYWLNANHLFPIGFGRGCEYNAIRMPFEPTGITKRLNSTKQSYWFSSISRPRNQVPAELMQCLSKPYSPDAPT
ncbi:MAG: hypothetical protein Aurels2KO_56400 [Aureliella sp.]